MVVKPSISYFSPEDKLRLGKLLRMEEDLQASDEGLLRSVLDSWPWYHEAWMLLALWEKTFSPERFRERLPLLALRSGQGRFLDQLLYPPLDPRLPSAVVEAVSNPEATTGEIVNEKVVDRTTFLEELVRKRLAAIEREKAEARGQVGHGQPKRTAEIIERFIQQEPRMRPRQDISPEPDEKAEKSIQDDTSLVSETLARIHEKQGNYQKAMEIYRSLSLKYPQKSTYFAAQIEKLQEKLKP